MLLFYVRHGDPIYDPDSLTEQGRMQAQALVKRMERCRPSKIFASSSNRAIMTAEPTAKMLGQDIQILAWCNESYAAETFWYVGSGGEGFWMFGHPESRPVLASEEIRRLDREWYKHPFFKNGSHIEKGIRRIRENTDRFMLDLGYRQIENGFIAERPNDERIALFAHQGFGLAFLSELLDIPYPAFSTRFDMCHTGMTVIDFSGEGFVVPKVLQLSNDSHIFSSDLPTKYKNIIEF